MEESKKSFLEELQSLGEPAKQKILIAATIVIMIAVVYLWLGYFNGLVMADQVGQKSSGTGGGSGFVQGLVNNLASIANTFRHPGQYNIQPPQ